MTGHRGRTRSRSKAGRCARARPERSACGPIRSRRRRARGRCSRRHDQAAAVAAGQLKPSPRWRARPHRLPVEKSAVLGQDGALGEPFGPLQPGQQTMARRRRTSSIGDSSQGRVRQHGRLVRRLAGAWPAIVNRGRQPAVVCRNKGYRPKDRQHFAAVCLGKRWSDALGDPGVCRAGRSIRGWIHPPSRTR